MAKTAEIWKTVDVNENYEVSTTGKIRHRFFGRELKPVVNHKGLHQVALSKDSNSKTYCLEKLILRAFNPLDDELEYPRCYTVIHKDGNIENNNVNNLVWKTKKLITKRAKGSILPDEYTILYDMLCQSIETVLKKWYILQMTNINNSKTDEDN